MAGRLVSLDVFRGLTVAGMVVVNNPGSWRAVYPPLRHADWHGWTPTDLIFPFFLFIVGVAIPMALGRRLAEGHGRGPLVGRILRRSAIIFALGLFLHLVSGRFDLATVRIPGVLQRIAVCYLVASLLYLVAGWRGQAVVAAVALLGYWAALTLIPVPGFGAGDLGKEGNLAAWLDRALLGAHIWRFGRVYDPEGILSTVPAIATTLIGVLTGAWMRMRPAAAILRGLVAAGVVCLAVGVAWGQWFPINKSLWTSSYVVFTAGAALLALGACYWLIEIRGWRWWTPPFAVLGVNALAVFFLSTLLAIGMARLRVPPGGPPLQATLYGALFAPWAPAAAASLAWALANALLWLLIVWPLYRRNIRLAV